MKGRIDALKAADPNNNEPVPADLVLASGSGLDPHISPGAAEYQISRVAKIRGLTVETLRKLVQRFTEGRQLGIFGQPRVNVLKLNLALDYFASHPDMKIGGKELQFPKIERGIDTKVSIY